MDDIARQLPTPPPPRPAGRTVAIAAALARFDGDVSPPSATIATAAERPTRWRIGRGSAGVFASVLLVALIGVPVALLRPDKQVSTPRPPATRAALPQSDAVRDGFSDTAPPAVIASSDVRPPRPSPPALRRANAEPVAVPVIAPAPPPEPVMPAPAPPPAPPPPAAMVAAPDARAVASASAARATLSDGARDDIVVTGSRVSNAATNRVVRGDWNACTVDDPDHRLRGCRAATRSNRGDVATHLADGLTKGWQGDWDASIAAFDAAIALQPKLAVAHLNRGLAYWRSGDGDRAAADLDLAVRYAPTARSYYNRALLRRERGDRRGAQADEARARALDPDYAAVLKE